MVTSFSSVSRSFPRVRKLLWKVLYQSLARFYQNADWTFMNYGFDPLGSGDEAPDLSADDEPNRYFIQLYRTVLHGETVNSRDVAEIGCGRGGGSAYIARYLRPRSVWGVDLSSKALRFCRKRHHLPQLRFRVGDSEELPFENESFDAVINVESSHCYPRFDRFLAEARRILRPGGSFHIADLRDDDQVRSFHASLRSSGMKIEAGGDITRNVVAAMESDSPRRIAHFRHTMLAPLVRYFQEFAGNPESVIYRKFREGRAYYFSYLLRA